MNRSPLRYKDLIKDTDTLFYPNPGAVYLACAQARKTGFTLAVMVPIIAALIFLSYFFMVEDPFGFGRFGITILVILGTIGYGIGSGAYFFAQSVNVIDLSQEAATCEMSQLIASAQEVPDDYRLKSALKLISDQGRKPMIIEARNLEKYARSLADKSRAEAQVDVVDSDWSHLTKAL